MKTRRPAAAIIFLVPAVLLCSLALLAGEGKDRQGGPREGTLKVGDPAPDFTLSSPDGKTTMALSSFRGKKPVVLVFGSFT